MDGWSTGEGQEPRDGGVPGVLCARNSMSSSWLVQGRGKRSNTSFGERKREAEGENMILSTLWDTIWTITMFQVTNGRLRKIGMGGILLLFSLNNRNFRPCCDGIPQTAPSYSRPLSLYVGCLYCVNSAASLDPPKRRQRVHENSERGGWGRMSLHFQCLYKV